MRTRTGDCYCLPLPWGPGYVSIRADWVKFWTTKRGAFNLSVQLGLSLVTRQGGFFRITLASIFRRLCTDLCASSHLSSGKEILWGSRKLFLGADGPQAVVPSLPTDPFRLQASYLQGALLAHLKFCLRGDLDLFSKPNQRPDWDSVLRHPKSALPLTPNATLGKAAPSYLVMPIPLETYMQWVGQ